MQRLYLLPLTTQVDMTPSVKFQNGDNIVGCIDSNGNLLVEYSGEGSFLIQNQDAALLEPKSNIKEWVVRKGSNDYLVNLDLTTGRWKIKGKLIEYFGQEESLTIGSAPAPHLIFKKGNNIIAFIDSAGNMFLKGRVMAYNFQD